jgi:hypothetical protein
MKFSKNLEFGSDVARNGHSIDPVHNSRIMGIGEVGLSETLFHECLLTALGSQEKKSQPLHGRRPLLYTKLFN